MARHKFWELIEKGTRATETEKCLIAAIIQLSVTIYGTDTFERIYDDLLTQKRCRSFTEHNAVIERLTRMEKEIMNTSAAVSRLQKTADTLKAQQTATQTALADLMKAMLDANTRLETDIANLRNAAGSGDTDALNAIADSLDLTAAGFKTVSDQLSAAATAESAVDPTPVAPPALVIDPSTVTMARTATQQFTASTVGSTFTAISGTVDTTGLYTPPTDVTITSDTVTATSPDGKQTAVASVSISG